HAATSLAADGSLVSAPDDDKVASLAHRTELHAEGFGGRDARRVRGVLIDRVRDLELEGDVPRDRGELKRSLKDAARALKQESRGLGSEGFRVVGCIPWEGELSAPGGSHVAGRLTGRRLHPGGAHQRRVRDLT